MKFRVRKPSDIHFKEQLYCSEDSVIYLLEVYEKLLVLKIHRYFEPYPWSPRDQERDPYICESKAYERLKEHGVCDRGIVPNFYGTIERMDRCLYRPHINMFFSDRYAPNAIVLEYIPNMQMLCAENYTISRKESFVSGIREIHEALIRHCSGCLQHMMIINGNPKRVH
ncbi:hypothetical protein F5884DRAFT_765149 [Xylogone sp. PMI_703]|nr:hypothetical protein F5884DRAFT_765149 [Xylogone sp. PMI_703]